MNFQSKISDRNIFFSIIVGFYNDNETALNWGGGGAKYISPTSNWNFKKYGNFSSIYQFNALSHINFVFFLWYTFHFAILYITHLINLVTKLSVQTWCLFMILVKDKRRRLAYIFPHTTLMRYQKRTFDNCQNPMTVLSVKYYVFQKHSF